MLSSYWFFTLCFFVCGFFFFNDSHAGKEMVSAKAAGSVEWFLFRGRERGAARRRIPKFLPFLDSKNGPGL